MKSFNQFINEEFQDQQKTFEQYKQNSITLNVRGKDESFEVGDNLDKENDNCWFIEFDDEGDPLGYFWWDCDLYNEVPQTLDDVDENKCKKIISSSIPGIP